jgi:hypothetical protein
MSFASHLNVYATPYAAGASTTQQKISLALAGLIKLRLATCVHSIKRREKLLKLSTRLSCVRQVLHYAS